MHHHAIMVGLAALTLTGTASAEHARYAQSNCDSQRNDQKLVGGLIGGTLGAFAGVALGNNLGDGGHRRGRGYSYGGHGGYNSYGGRGGYNNYGGHNRRRSGNDDTEQIIGALILGGLGAYAGSQIAGSSVKCRTQVYEGIPAPTREAYGSAWGNSPPPYQQVGTRENELYGGQYTRRNNAPVPETKADTRECEPVYRETRLPDGRMIREEVQACRDGVTYYEPRTAYSDWGVED